MKTGPRVKEKVEEVVEVEEVEEVVEDNKTLTQALTLPRERGQCQINQEKRLSRGPDLLEVRLFPKEKEGDHV